MWRVVCALLAAALPVTGHAFEDEVYNDFPRLFHLDDYSRCLSQPQGLYCVGSFHLTPAHTPHPLYDRMKRYSKLVNSFNRTLLHRGYCVNRRCPAHSEPNVTLRFESCVDRWSKQYDLHAKLQVLNYCRSRDQAVRSSGLTAAKRAFLYVTCVLLLLNIVGTAYDVLAGDTKQKWAALSAWSVRANWQRLTAAPAADDPRLVALQPLQGLRVVIMLTVILTHVGMVHHMMYVYHPHLLEKISVNPLLVLVKNGTSVVQVFVVISSFLFVYNMLLYSSTQPISYRQLPKIIMHRFIRLAPVHVWAVGLASSWWEALADGPLWAPGVEVEAATCRRKFWGHAFFLNNVLQAQEFCLVPTWFVAVDMQLYLVTAVLTLALLRRQRLALLLLPALALLATLINMALAYRFRWKTVMFFMNPEKLRVWLRGSPVASFWQYYTTPWGSLPAALLGLYLAFLYHRMQETGFKIHSHKIMIWLYQITIPLLLLWILSGSLVLEICRQSSLMSALYVGVDRPIVATIACFFLFVIFSVGNGFWHAVFSWRGWHAAGRMSLSALVLHWPVIMVAVAARPQPISTSFFDIVLDTISSAALTYTAAVPLTLLVEMPVYRSLVTFLA